MNKLKKSLLTVSCICCVTMMSGCSVTETVDKIMGKTNEAATKDVVEKKVTDGKKISDSVAVPQIVTDLEGSVTYTLGTPAEPLTVEAVSSDGGTISYQWYCSDVDVNGGGDVIEGATAASYTPNVSEAGSNYYYVLITNTVGDGIQMTTSGLKEVVVLVTDGTSDGGDGQADGSAADGTNSPQEGAQSSDDGSGQPADTGE